jgi:Protein of unknown function (DUF1566)
MKKILMFSLLIAVTSNVFAIPTLIEASATGTTVKFATKLSETLPKGYKVKIDLNNGKGLVAMTCSKLICSLSSNALPVGVNSVDYKIGIYDSNGALKSEILGGTYQFMASIQPTVILPVQPYVKISNSGKALSDVAILGSGANDWACTKDTKTGLTWEVKTIDGGLRDKNNVYTNYWVDGHGPTDGGPNNYGKSGNSDVFVKDVNAQNLCGYADWRLPTQNELKTLIYCSGDACQYAYVTINTVFFPNTQGNRYWTSSTSTGYYAVPYFVYFGSDGYNGGGAMSDKHYIRLVRGNS